MAHKYIKMYVLQLHNFKWQGSNRPVNKNEFLKYLNMSKENIQK